MDGIGGYRHFRTHFAGDFAFGVSSKPAGVELLVTISCLRGGLLEDGLVLEVTLGLT